MRTVKLTPSQASDLYGDVRLWQPNAIPTPWLKGNVVNLDVLRADILQRKAQFDSAAASFSGNTAPGYVRAYQENRDYASVLAALLPFTESGRFSDLPTAKSVEDYVFQVSGTRPELKYGSAAAYNSGPATDASQPSSQPSPAALAGIAAAALAAWWWLK